MNTYIEKLENRNDLILSEAIDIIALPMSDYKKAVDRYENLGNFLAEVGSLLNYAPHIFSQGSFALGTVIRPINNREEYDLDLVCNLCQGITRELHKQSVLKELIGAQLSRYVNNHGFKKSVFRKNRCWRIEYQDSMSFHMDILPSIPCGENVDPLYITDESHPRYNEICLDWFTSNPKSYASWFHQRSDLLKKAGRMNLQVDNVPLYTRKSILQQVIMLLKRHRDCWCETNPKLKPASILITTLAAQAYNGETNISCALKNIVNSLKVFSDKIDGVARFDYPVVPNPVNPQEDFASKWFTDEGKNLNLQKAFVDWVRVVNRDFSDIMNESNSYSVYSSFKLKLKISIREPVKQKILAIGIGLGTLSVAETCKPHTFNPTNAPRPFGATIKNSQE